MTNILFSHILFKLNKCIQSYGKLCHCHHSCSSWKSQHHETKPQTSLSHRHQTTQPMLSSGATKGRGHACACTCKHKHLDTQINTTFSLSLLLFLATQALISNFCKRWLHQKCKHGVSRGQEIQILLTAACHVLLVKHILPDRSNH